MVRLLADENFDNDIVRGALRRNVRLDIVRAQDVGLSGTADLDVLIWAAQDGRVVLTHDVKTMTHAAIQRIQRGEPMTGFSSFIRKARRSRKS